MKKIKIKFVDYWPNHHLTEDIIYRWLSNHYEIELSEQPEYVIYSCFGYEHLKYDCVRIFYTAENFAPDFNECDYALCFEKMKFGDRCMELPNFFKYRKEIEVINSAERKESDSELLERGFCSYVVSNGCGNKIREDAFDELAKYKEIASGGRFKNNVGGPIEDKIEFQKKYKFALTFENSSHIGYTTEKILQAFASRTVPIYWGDPQVTDYFNPNAFVNVMNFSCLKEALKYVEELDCDDKRYLQYVRQCPWREANVYSNKMMEFDAFMSNIIEQDYDKAFRRNMSAMSDQSAKNVCIWKEYYENSVKVKTGNSIINNILFFLRKIFT